MGLVIETCLFWIASFASLPRNDDHCKRPWSDLLSSEIVIRCLTTLLGLIIKPSAFINSVHTCNWSSGFLYCSKIWLVMKRVAQSVIQSIGAKQSFTIRRRKIKKLVKNRGSWFLKNPLPPRSKGRFQIQGKDSKKTGLSLRKAYRESKSISFFLEFDIVSAFDLKNS